MPLLITRKANESFTIGNNITITVAKIKDHQVTLSIEAPRNLPILRDDIIKTEPTNPINNQ